MPEASSEGMADLGLLVKHFIIERANLHINLNKKTLCGFFSETKVNPSMLGFAIFVSEIILI